MTITSKYINFMKLTYLDKFIILFFLVVHKKILLTRFAFFNLKIHKSIVLKFEFSFKKCLFDNLLEPDLAARKIPILSFFIVK